MLFRALILCGFVTIVATSAKAARSPDAADKPAAVRTAASLPSARRPQYVTTSLRGQVVWMSEALQRRYGVRVVAAAKEQLLALETAEGKLLPIVEDTRGRSLRIDKRLRAMDLELLVRQYPQSPMIQVIRMYEWRRGKKYAVDYWCDICAIPMFEMGACSCCQAPNHLRERPAGELQP